jgi:hypothetical protein
MAKDGIDPVKTVNLQQVITSTNLQMTPERTLLFTTNFVIRVQFPKDAGIGPVS